jgi:uncharacterized membrane protein YraQ (UPF0718 family)
MSAPEIEPGQFPGTPRLRSPTSNPGRRAIDVFGLVLVLALALRILAPGALSDPAVSAWTTVFVALCVQASPYLALGVGVSTAIAVFVPAQFFQRALPRRPELAVAVAGLAGAALPGCECGSVPVAAV